MADRLPWSNMGSANRRISGFSKAWPIS